MDKAVRRWRRTKSAAEYIGMSAATLAMLRLHGTGPAYSKVGRPVVYDEADLDAWVASRRVETREIAPEALRKLRKAGKGALMASATDLVREVA